MIRSPGGKLLLTTPERMADPEFRTFLAKNDIKVGETVLNGAQISRDVIIATEGSNIGMGGPAMIEGGGLGVYAPTEVGPMSVQVPNGVVDIEVDDEAEAVPTGEVRVEAQGLEDVEGQVEPVAHATITYALPPKSPQRKD